MYEKHKCYVEEMHVLCVQDTNVLHAQHKCCISKGYDIEESEVTQIYQPEVRVLFRLPGTHMNHRFLWIVQVYHQEQISRVTVAGREVILLDLNAVDFTSYARLTNLVISKSQIDKFRAAEDVLQLLHIFRLCLAGVLHSLFAHGLSLVADGVFQHRTGNDQGIVGENAVDVIVAFQSISCLVAFEEVDKYVAHSIVPRRLIHDIVYGRFVEAEGETVYLAFLVQSEHDVFYKRALVALEFETQRQAATGYFTIAFQEFELRFADDFGLAVFDKAVEHIVPVFGTQVLNAIVVAGTDGTFHLLHGVFVSCRLHG